MTARTTAEKATGATALVWVRGSGSRPQVQETPYRPPGFSSLASPVVSYHGSKIDWGART
jgi:hypothetical protein